MNRFTIINDQRKLYLESVGIPQEHCSKWVAKCTTLKMHCEQTGKEFSLTFHDYINLALDAGITNYEDIGRGKDSFQMGRIGDVGGYVIGNCRFISKQQNILERSLNGGSKRGGEKRKGRKRTHIQGRYYEITTPQGEVVVGQSLLKFCTTHNLQQTRMWSVLNGTTQKGHYKGYSGRFLTKEEAMCKGYSYGYFPSLHNIEEGVVENA